MQNYTIMVIEDDPHVNRAVAEALSYKYEKVAAFTDPLEAKEELDNINPDLVLLDIFLGHENGLDILEQFRSNGYVMPVVIMTAFSDVKMAVRAMKLGAEDFIVKPLDLEQLEIVIEKAIQNYDLRRQVDLLSEKLSLEVQSEIIGTSEPIIEAMKKSKRFADSRDTTVLILGESGTGKELLARYIHDNSARNKGPFVTINCGAIPRELAENELFGYEKGAFTGATEKFKPGKFEQAHHGTILLDEIGELSLELQVKLLRVLQEKKFYRLGGQKEINVDVRVIASTNRDLEKHVEENKFREDLFYRLNVATITLPPLRERGSDIMLIARTFIDKFNKKIGRTIKGFTPEGAEIINNYHWKGNIRELSNVIERVVLLESNDIISRDSLDFLKYSAPKELVQVENNQTIEIKDGQHYLKISKKGVSMGEVIKDLILQTFLLTNGNQIQAAKLLGISRAKLRYRLEQLGITNSRTSN